MKAKQRIVSKVIIYLFVLLIFAGVASAQVKLPALFSDNMVLQRDTSCAVWGWAEAGETITISICHNTVITKADPNGKWMTKLPALKAGGPFTMIVKGKETITIENVLIGDVWICGGQSNMEFQVADVFNRDKEIANAKYPAIRSINIPNKTSGKPKDDVVAKWSVCSPDTVAGFTAVGYFFAREIHTEINIPIGLIDSDWGGTRIEPWTPPVGFAMVDSLKTISDEIELAGMLYRTQVKKSLEDIENWLPAARKAVANNTALPQAPEFPKHQLDDYWQPTGMYNAMIAPLVPYGIKGALWYQGEANLGEGMVYYEKTKALIGGWRKVFGQGDFPFYFAQLAPYNYGSNNPNDPYRLPEIWEAQVKSLEIPNTGMAVTTDLVDNIRDIHPKNKQDVGKRLALWALAKTYGQEGIIYSGPLYKSAKVDNGKIVISFDHVAKGLATLDGKEPSHFEIAGADGKYVEAKAVLYGNSIIVSSDKVAVPVSARYGWHQEAMGNLCNSEKLPASPFRTK